MQNLWAVLVGDLIQWALKRGAARGEGAGRNVVLQQLLLHDVDNGRDQRLDVLGARDESFDVACH